MVYDFLEENWEIAKWVALGIVIFEVSTGKCHLLLRQNVSLFFPGSE